MSKFSSQIDKEYKGPTVSRSVGIPDSFYEELWLRCPVHGMFTEVVTTCLIRVLEAVAQEIPEKEYKLENARKYKDILRRVTVLPADGSRYEQNDGRGVERVHEGTRHSLEVSSDEQIKKFTGN